MKLSLEDPAYVEQTLAEWGRSRPLSMAVVEFFGVGDPFFGGTADDRPLGLNGLILSRGSNEPIAEFDSIEDAHHTAKAVRNRRADSSLGVLPRWR